MSLGLSVRDAYISIQYVHIVRKETLMKNIDDDNGCNTSGNKTFQDVVEARVSRRGFLRGGLAAAAFSLAGSMRC